jgi:hypothetical protein
VILPSVISPKARSSTLCDSFSAFRAVIGARPPGGPDPKTYVHGPSKEDVTRQGRLAGRVMKHDARLSKWGLSQASRSRAYTGTPVTARSLLHGHDADERLAGGAGVDAASQLGRADVHGAYPGALRVVGPVLGEVGGLPAARARGRRPSPPGFCGSPPTPHAARRQPGRRRLAAAPPHTPAGTGPQWWGTRR